ncbi:DUF421 domain-containing protein [Rhodocytophaga aerolata]|uniref:DUF421 domain-containing protein n=1 Tax=Rhodocytophaga aerolata TaxID=455078 RepID=A0ABT8RFV4_9BACT|nr:DUF421 domain-containing protein [Rhodocytophaga aerolata]MDO1450219.1 DUF421 domain-containing protein [Rhodocytophaga aerolata]
MEIPKLIQPLDWKRIWLSDELPIAFLLEVAFRSTLMYVLIVLTLRITGKRGVKQLSLFELTIILSLGSAAGDAMFYHDVALLHVLMVFGIVILLYLGFNRLTEQSPRAERWLEGHASCIIEEGILNIDAFNKENLTFQELFGEMRQQHVEHLGQVKKLYLEATGEISVFFYEKEQVKPGMPIFPEIISKPFQTIVKTGEYACNKCGKCQKLLPGNLHKCSNCQNHQWLNACTAIRTT